LPVTLGCDQILKSPPPRRIGALPKQACVDSAGPPGLAPAKPWQWQKKRGIILSVMMQYLHIRI
jgi:hypothetical protein